MMICIRWSLKSVWSDGSARSHTTPLMMCSCLALHSIYVLYVENSRYRTEIHAAIDAGLHSKTIAVVVEFSVLRFSVEGNLVRVSIKEFGWWETERSEFSLLSSWMFEEICDEMLKKLGE